MRYLISIGLLFISLLTYSQQKTETLKFLEDFFSLKLRTDTAYFISPRDFEIDEMIEAFKEGFIEIKSGKMGKFSFVQVGNSDTLIISLNEKKKIIKNLERMKTNPWETDIYQNLKLIHFTEIDNIFSDSSKGWDYFNKHYSDRYYTISKPIFIRNNKLCFFFYTDRGNVIFDIYGDFSIYKKNYGFWHILMQIIIWEG